MEVPINFNHLKHPYIEVLYNINNNDDKTKKALMKMNGSILKDYLFSHKISDIEKLMIALDIAEIIDFLHLKNIAHRDLKTKNIVIMKNKQSKLIIHNDVAKTVKSKISRIHGEKNPSTIHYDIWSFGFLLDDLFAKPDNNFNKKRKENLIYFTPHLYLDYQFQVSKTITNEKIITLIENLTTNNAECNFTIRNAKKSLYQIFLGMVKQQKIEMSPFQSAFIDKDVGSDPEIREDNGIYILNQGDIVNISNDFNRYLVVSKIQKYLILYKEDVAKEVQKQVLLQSIIKSAIQEYYLINNKNSDKRLANKKFLRQLTRFYSDKCSLEDFLKVKLTNEMVNNFSKRINIAQFPISSINFDKSHPNYDLGDGGQAKVRRAKIFEQEIAVKILQEFSMDMLIKEVNIFKKFYHSYIPLVYGIYRNEDTYNNKVSINIAMELINGETLNKGLVEKKYCEIEKIIILLDLALVLEYIHNFGMIHRDLKPENVMINKKLDVKLIDFGISRTVSDEGYNPSKIAGTTNYMAPENYEEIDIDFNYEDYDPDADSQNEEEKQNPKITTKVDVWAYGLIANEVLTGDTPYCFISNRNDEKINLFLLKKRKYKLNKNLNDEIIKKLLTWCLMTDPEDRATMVDAKELLYELLYTKVKELGNINKLWDLKNNDYMNEYHKLKYDIDDKLRNLSSKRFYYLTSKIEKYLKLFQHNAATKKRVLISRNVNDNVTELIKIHKNKTQVIKRNSNNNLIIQARLVNDFNQTIVGKADDSIRSWFRRPKKNNINIPIVENDVLNLNKHEDEDSDILKSKHNSALASAIKLSLAQLKSVEIEVKNTQNNHSNSISNINQKNSNHKNYKFFKKLSIIQDKLEDFKENQKYEYKDNKNKPDNKDKPDNKQKTPSNPLYDIESNKNKSFNRRESAIVKDLFSKKDFSFSNSNLFSSKRNMIALNRMSQQNKINTRSKDNKIIHKDHKDHKSKDNIDYITDNNLNKESKNSPILQTKKSNLKSHSIASPLPNTNKTIKFSDSMVKSIEILKKSSSKVLKSFKLISQDKDKDIDKEVNNKVIDDGKIFHNDFKEDKETKEYNDDLFDLRKRNNSLQKHKKESKLSNDNNKSEVYSENTNNTNISNNSSNSYLLNQNFNSALCLKYKPKNINHNLSPIKIKILDELNYAKTNTNLNSNLNTTINKIEIKNENKEEFVVPKYSKSNIVLLKFRNVINKNDKPKIDKHSKKNKIDYSLLPSLNNSNSSACFSEYLNTLNNLNTGLNTINTEFNTNESFNYNVNNANNANSIDFNRTKLKQNNSNDKVIDIKFDIYNKKDVNEEVYIETDYDYDALLRDRSRKKSLMNPNHSTLSDNKRNGQINKKTSHLLPKINVVSKYKSLNNSDVNLKQDTNTNFNVKKENVVSNVGGIVSSTNNTHNINVNNIKNTEVVSQQIIDLHNLHNLYNNDNDNENNYENGNNIISIIKKKFNKHLKAHINTNDTINDNHTNNINNNNINNNNNNNNTHYFTEASQSEKRVKNFHSVSNVNYSEIINIDKSPMNCLNQDYFKKEVNHLKLKNNSDNKIKNPNKSFKISLEEDKKIKFKINKEFYCKLKRNGIQ